jgi:hydroxyacylglutathione hydrolase
MEVVAETKELRIERMELGSWATNSYIIQCLQTGKCVLVDMPPGALTILKELEQRVPEYILLTHNHVDHTAGLQAFRNQLKVPLAVHPLDSQDGLPFRPERLLSQGDEIPVGNLKINVLHTPGHTPGSICFRVDNYLLAGDTLFPGGPGRTASPLDFEQIIRSITGRILSLPAETQVHPGHGGPTTIREAQEEYAAFVSRPPPTALFGDVEWRNS